MDKQMCCSSGVSEKKKVYVRSLAKDKSGNTSHSGEGG